MLQLGRVRLSGPFAVAVDQPPPGATKKSAACAAGETKNIQKQKSRKHFIADMVPPFKDGV
jgi:hypothetical protein